MNLEIVSHCWNYSRLLTYQLSSLALAPPERVSVLMTVLFTPSDERTCRVLDWFGKLAIPNVDWRWWELEQSRLCRRAIGRNLCATACEADWIWFTDADMCFGCGCLDALPAQLEKRTEPLVYPRSVQISIDHGKGDEAIARASGPPRLIGLDPADFAAKRYRRAIGGVQICRGEVARREGYCRHSRRDQRPAPRWRGCVGDRTFRQSLGTKGVPIELPNLYRIRHSKRGRDHVGIEL